MLRRIEIKTQEQVQEEVLELVEIIRRQFIAEKKRYPDELETKQIFASVSFVIDHSEYSGMIQRSILEHYESGMKVLQERINQVQNMYMNLQTLVLPFENDRYQKVINIHIPRFLETYDLTYNAVAILYDFDYPLVDGLPLNLEMMSLNGIDFVREYLGCLQVEHEFLDLYRNQLTGFIASFEYTYGISVFHTTLSLTETVVRNVMINISNHLNPQLLMQEGIDYSKKVTLQDFLKSIQSNESFYNYFKGHCEGIQAQLDIAFEKQVMESHYIHEHKGQMLRYVTASHFSLKQLDVLSVRWIETMDIDIFKKKMSTYEVMTILDVDVMLDDYCKLFDTFDNLIIAQMIRMITPETFAFNATPRLNRSWLKRIDVKKHWEYQCLKYVMECSESKQDCIIELARRLVDDFYAITTDE